MQAEWSCGWFTQRDGDMNLKTRSTRKSVVLYIYQFCERMKVIKNMIQLREKSIEASEILEIQLYQTQFGWIQFRNMNKV